MPAGIFNLIDVNAIEQGSDFAFSIVYANSAGSPINLTGATITAEIKEDWNTSTLATFTSTTTGTPTDGVINLSLPAASSASIPPGIYKYDILVVLSGGSTEHILKGSCEIAETVSR